FHGERDVLVAAAVARAGAELLDLQAAALGIAGQHPVQVAGPERGLVAADAVPDFDDRVFGIVRVTGCKRLPERQLAISEPRLELRDQLAEIAVGRGRVEVRARLAPFLGKPERRLAVLEL